MAKKKDDSGIYAKSFFLIFIAVLVFIIWVSLNIYYGIWKFILFLIGFLIVIYLLSYFIKTKFPKSKIGRFIIKVIDYVKEFVQGLIVNI